MYVCHVMCGTHVMYKFNVKIIMLKNVNYKLQLFLHVLMYSFQITEMCGLHVYAYMTCLCGCIDSFFLSTCN